MGDRRKYGILQLPRGSVSFRLGAQVVVSRIPLTYHPASKEEDLGVTGSWKLQNDTQNRRN